MFYYVAELSVVGGTARLRLMHMPDHRVGSVAKPRICGNGVQQRMPKYHRWVEKLTVLGAEDGDRLDFLGCTNPRYTEGVKLGKVVQAPVDVIEEAERTKISRRQDHHVGEPGKRRRKRAF